MNPSPEIDWPDHYHPRNCAVHVHNELDMAAPPDRVWAWLTHATLWPSWYGNSADVTFLDESGPQLQQGSRFRWKTFGVTVTSTVLEYVAGERLAWDAQGLGVDAYHAWVLQPTDRGCRVLTEETQHGWLARLGSIVLPNRMHKHHQRWLEGLESQARTGAPPTTLP